MQYYTCPGCGRPALGLFQGGSEEGEVRRVISQCSDCGLKQEWMDAAHVEQLIMEAGIALGRMVALHFETVEV